MNLRSDDIQDVPRPVGLPPRNSQTVPRPVSLPTQKSISVPRPANLPPNQHLGIPRPASLPSLETQAVRRPPRLPKSKLVAEKEDFFNRFTEVYGVTYKLRILIFFSILAWIVMAYQSADNHNLIGLSLIYITIGLVECYFGLAVFELIVALLWIGLGFILASVGGYGQPENFHIGIFLVFLFTAGLIATLAPLIGGFILGISFGVPVMAALDIPFSNVGILITGIIGAILTLFLFRIFVIFTTAIHGADLMTTGILLPFEGYSLYINDPDPFYYVVVIVLAISGIIVQFKFSFTDTQMSE